MNATPTLCGAMPLPKREAKPYRPSREFIITLVVAAIGIPAAGAIIAWLNVLWMIWQSLTWTPIPFHG